MIGCAVSAVVVVIVMALLAWAIDAYGIGVLIAIAFIAALGAVFKLQPGEDVDPGWYDDPNGPSQFVGGNPPEPLRIDGHDKWF